MSAPTLGEFEYRVSIQIALPVEHAELLHRTALHHYDAVVRESADHGPINGLRNVARWTRDHAVNPEPGDVMLPPHPLTFRQLDTAMKAMEQAREIGPGDANLIHQIRCVLREAMSRVAGRESALNNGVEP